MVLFYIFPFMRVVNKSLVHTVTELAIALGVAPATAYRAVIPGECLNLRLLRVFSVHPCQDPADNLERYPAVICSQAIVDLAELRKQQFDRAWVARDGFVDQLFDQRLALSDSPSLAVLTDDDRLLEHLLHQCREILRTPRAPLGISGLSFAKARVPRRLAKPDRVFGLVLICHSAPQPRLRARRSFGRLHRRVRPRRCRPASDG